MLPWPRRLTFRRGSVQAARYADGVQSVVYSAAWEGGPEEVYSATPDGAESRPLELPGTGLLAASQSGELLVACGRRFLRGYVKSGTLAVVTASGGAPRDRVEDVQWADWSRDARGFCVVRDAGGRNRLEFPVGNVVYETGGWVSHPRFSPAGDLIAFLDHPVQNDDGGSVAVVKLDGRGETLSSGWVSLQGLAWSPAGDEVWFTAARAGNARALRPALLLPRRGRTRAPRPRPRARRHGSALDGGRRRALHLPPRRNPRARLPPRPAHGRAEALEEDEAFGRRAGVHHLLRLLTTPDGASYAYSYTRDLSDLYQMEGLADPS